MLIWQTSPFKLALERAEYDAVVLRSRNVLEMLFNRVSQYFLDDACGFSCDASC